MEVNFKMLFYLQEFKNGSGIELNKVYKGILNHDKTKVSFIDLLGKKYLFKVGDDCGIIPDSEKNIFPGVKYQLEDAYDFLPKQVQNILDDFNLDDGQEGFERCRNLNNQLKKFGYYCEYGLDAEPNSIQKIKPLKNDLKL